MDKKTVLANLAAVANRLDERGVHNEADALTKIMRKVAQSAWWQNEAGEPMYSPEAIRAEENYVPDFGPDDDYDGRDDFEEEEPVYKSPTPGLMETVQSILGQPPGTPFLRGYTWGALSDSIVFENTQDMQKVIDWLQAHPEFNHEWSGYSFRRKAIMMPEETMDGHSGNYSEPREDFGWAGDERVMGE